jgi:hypothetical protein
MRFMEAQSIPHPHVGRKKNRLGLNMNWQDVQDKK